MADPRVTVIKLRCKHCKQIFDLVLTSRHDGGVPGMARRQLDRECPDHSGPWDHEAGDS